MANLGSIIKKVTGLAGVTLASRVLGFFREILTAHFLGGGSVAAAWEFAFTLPNLCRRVFGEGLLAQVLVPVVTHAAENEGKDAAKRKFSTIFFYSGICLGLITVFVSLASMILLEVKQWDPHWRMGLQLVPLVMPYSIFICLVGICTALMNSLRSYVLPALASLLLNIFLVITLLFIVPQFTGKTAAWGEFAILQDHTKILSSLSIAVLLSGIAELVLLFLMMKKAGMMPVFPKTVLKDKETLKEIFFLILPGLAGALTYQLGVICDRSMAMMVGDYALPALNYSERLTYLPIGVIAVSFGTVSLTEMSVLAAKGEYCAMKDMLKKAMDLLLFLTIPLAAFIFITADDLIRFCFMRGKFGETEAVHAAMALKYYAWGIPAFAAMKLSLAAFYSRKETKTPMLAAICCIGLNIILNFILMHPLKQGGIALATVVSSYINNMILLFLFSRDIRSGLLKETAKTAGKFLLLSIPAFLAVYYTAPYIKELPLFFVLCIKSILYGMVFLIFAMLFRIEEVKSVLGKIKGRKK